MYNNKINGHRWVNLAKEAKLEFVIGYIEGLYQGHCFSVWDLTADDRHESVIASFEGYWNTFIKDVPYDRYVEEIDRLYSGTRNRVICIFDGVWIAMNLIRRVGTQEQERQMIEVCIQRGKEIESNA